MTKMPTLLCADCGKEFNQYLSQIKNMNRPFCSKGCWYSYKSKNKITWNRGLIGVMKPNSGSFKKGERRSPKTEFRSELVRGEKNNNWKGGITPINTSIRQSKEYKDWRKKVFERDDYTCQFCFKRGESLQADHIQTFSKHHDLRFELSNGRTLCVDCHKKTPSYLKR